MKLLFITLFHLKAMSQYQTHEIIDGKAAKVQGEGEWE